MPSVHPLVTSTLPAHSQEAALQGQRRSVHAKRTLLHRDKSELAVQPLTCPHRNKNEKTLKVHLWLKMCRCSFRASVRTMYTHRGTARCIKNQKAKTSRTSRGKWLGLKLWSSWCLLGSWMTFQSISCALSVIHNHLRSRHSDSVSHTKLGHLFTKHVGQTLES